MTNKPYILIVDDIEDNLILLEEILKSADADIIKVMSGDDALSIIKNSPPALALIDIIMPGMNGYELAEKIRNDKSRDVFPIMFITAIDKNERDIFKGYESGAIDYIFKPFNSFILKNKVNLFLEMDKQKHVAIINKNKIEKAKNELEKFKIKLEEQNELLKISETRFHGLFKNMFEGYAFCQMIYEKGKPVDWIYLEVNDKFEELTGLKNITGKKVSEAIPGLKEKDPRLFELYSKVALTGQAKQFEIYLDTLKAWYSVSVYSQEEGFFIAVFDVITELKQLEDERKQSQDKLRAFATMLQQNKEEERKNIAREIHDEFGQVLTAIKMNLTILENEVKISGKSLNVENIFDEISNMKNVIDSTIQKVRIFTNKLRPDVLDTFGLVEALDSYIDEFSTLYNIKCNFLKPEEIEIDYNLSITVYRIVQEALTNIIRHAMASEVNITIIMKNNILNVSIEDNGIGMDEKQPANLKKLGIIGMKERAYICGGVLNIKSEPGNGTKIELIIPLQKND